jgi:microcin C transport system permease protein
MDAVVAPEALATPAGRTGWFRLTPINRRRLAAFKRNRRGYWSFVIFSALFAVSLGAEFVSNERPLVVSYKGDILFPVFNDYPEERFGGFLAHTPYRSATTAKEIEDHGWMVWAPNRYSNGTRNLSPPTAVPSPPTWMLSDAQCVHAITEAGGTPPASRPCSALEVNWLGTDDLGRDVLARLIYGFRLSVIFALLLAGLSSVVGIAAGAVQGYFGGWTDLVMQRVIEVWSSLPHLYILIIMAAVITPSFWVLLGILLLFSWVNLVHLVRAEFLRARNFEYVNAARALGLSNLRIMWTHVLPNATVATLTFMPFILSGAITTLTSLDFLGLGLPSGSPSLGEMLLQGTTNLHAPWLGLTAFFTIAGMLTLLIFIGEAVRDAFDPRKSLR